MQTGVKTVNPLSLPVYTFVIDGKHAYVCNIEAVSRIEATKCFFDLYNIREEKLPKCRGYYTDNKGVLRNINMSLAYKRYKIGEEKGNG